MSSDSISHENWKRHLAWRRDIAAGLPEIAMRVFALRGKLYSGCGGHYTLERSLGNVIELANTMDDEPSLSTSFMDEIAYEHLLESLAAAETSGKE